jgi:U3 small nucleolar RNA-associated protein 21
LLTKKKELAKRARRLRTTQRDLKLNSVIDVACCAAKIRERVEFDTVVTAHEDDNSAHTWNWAQKRLGRFALKTRDPRRGALVCAVTMSVCGNFAYVASNFGWIDQFNVQSGLHQRSFHDMNLPSAASSQKRGKNFEPAHNGSITGLCADSLNRFLVSCGLDGTVKFWDLRSLVGNQPRLLQSTGYVPSFTGKLLATYRIPVAGGDVVEDVAALKMILHRDTGLLAVACDDLTVKVLDADFCVSKIDETSPGFRVALIRAFTASIFSRASSDFADASLTPSFASVNCMCFSPDARWIVAGCSDSVIRVWDIASARLVDWWSVKRPVSCMTFAPSGQFLATSHDGGTRSGEFLPSEVGVSLWANLDYFGAMTTDYMKAIHPERGDVPRSVIMPGVINPQADHSDDEGESSSDSGEDMSSDDDAEMKDGQLNGLSVGSLVLQPSPGTEIVEHREDEDADGLATRSTLPSSRWRVLRSMDIVKARNKPMEAPKKPSTAPFFLPMSTTQSAGSNSAAQNTMDRMTASGDAIASAKQERLEQLDREEEERRERLVKGASDLVRAVSGAAFDDGAELFSMCEVASPATLDGATQQLPEVFVAPLALLLASRIETRQHADVSLALAHLLVKYHGHLLASPGASAGEEGALLAAAGGTLLDAVASTWEELEEAFDSTLCLLRHFSGAVAV